MTLLLLNLSGYRGPDMDRLLDTLRTRLDLDVQATMDIDDHGFDPAIASLGIESLGVIIAAVALRLQWQDHRGKAKSEAAPSMSTSQTPQLSREHREVVEQLASALEHAERACATTSGYRLSVNIRREVITVEGTVDAQPKSAARADDAT